MKGIRKIAIGFLLLVGSVSYGQRTISEGTVTYDITIQPKNVETKVNSALNGAKNTVYLKGGLSRIDMTSSLGTETTIYNAKAGNSVVLKEYSGQKLMITLTKENWDARNKKFEGILFKTGTETKTIEGYECKKAVAQLKDGTVITVYYTPDLIAMNKEYNQAFKNLPGFPISYEFETDKIVFKYQLSQIDFSPVSASKFEFPKAGYRVMTYDESKKGAADAL